VTFALLSVSHCFIYEKKNVGETYHLEVGAAVTSY